MHLFQLIETRRFGFRWNRPTWQAYCTCGGWWHPVGNDTTEMTDSWRAHLVLGGRTP